MGDDDMITSAGPRILMIFDSNGDGVIEYAETPPSDVLV